MFTSRVTVCCSMHGLNQSCFRTNYIISFRCLADRAKAVDSGAQEKESFQYYTIASEQVTKGPSPKHDTDVALRRISLVDLAKSKLYEAQSFYDEFSGMNEVKVAQNKVIEIQDQLQLVQERRRHILLELTLVRKQLQDIHIELQKATRGEHRYVELIKQEFDVGEMLYHLILHPRPFHAFSTHPFGFVIASRCSHGKRRRTKSFKSSTRRSGNCSRT